MHHYSELTLDDSYVVNSWVMSSSSTYRHAVAVAFAVVVVVILIVVSVESIIVISFDPRWK